MVDDRVDRTAGTLRVRIETELCAGARRAMEAHSAAMTATGTFVWYELWTTDVRAARAFCAAVLGWQARPLGASEGAALLEVDGQPVAGLRALPDAARARGAPPHWLGYVAVADVDATVARAEELGGRRLGPVQELPGPGRFARLQDPHGAVLAACAPAEATPQLRETVGWHELSTTDAGQAQRYYAELFGWRERGRAELGPGLPPRTLFASDSGRSVGAMSNAARTPGITPHWLHLVTTADLRSALARVGAAGGVVVRGPVEMPGGSLVAVCEDPQGAAFGLRQPSRGAGDPRP